MPTFTSIRSRSGSRDGVALLAVLAFILLLTILVVSFISFTRLNRLSTASYSSSVQAQEIAKGGMADILSDLHQEIIAGSIKDTTGTTYTTNGITIYVPATNSTAVPARIGYGAAYFATNMTATTFAPTLIRVSRSTLNTSTYASTAFFTNLIANTGPYTNNLAAVPGGAITNRASWASTATNSVNGRSISAARWNKSYLLATNAASVPQPFTNCPPDWVYVTRTGSRVCTTADVTAGSLKPSVNLTATYTAPVAGQNPPASPVIGRYAFVMYDEGALLDANVAGYTAASAYINASAYTNVVSSPDSTTGMTQTVIGKSYLPYADLTQLPGMTQTAIDNLVKWRNASVASTGSGYLSGIISYAKNGFLDFQTSDSPFLSRQDLINYFAKIDSNINTSSATFSQALPYLGTFSRAVSAPSYSPPQNSSSDPNYHPPATPTLGQPTPPINYKNNAENPGNLTGVIANRDLANVRYNPTGGTAPYTVTHYYDNQAPVAPATTTATYTVNIGDPLLQNRFSLGKINWLSQVSPQPSDGKTTLSAVYATAIQACFGLVWDYPGATSSTTANGGNKCWNYVGSTLTSAGVFAKTSSSLSSNPASTIETLDQVAAEPVPREPNFFELLKAAILSGSLGLGPGPAAFNNGADNAAGSRNAPFDAKNPPGYNYADLLGGGSFFSHTFGPGSSVPVPQRIPDIQIIQIGANIIDQYDADSYPTAIYFPYNGVGANDPVSGTLANALYGPVDMVYGDENLPLLSKIVTIIASPHPSDTSDSLGNGNAGAPSADDNTHSMEGWLQPEIWNPHLQPNTLATTPLNYQIRAYGSAMTYVAEGGGYLAPDMTPPAGWVANPPATAINTPSTYSTNWSLSNSNIQTYWTGTTSSESATGTSEKVGTINFTISNSTPAFYVNPRLLVLSKIGVPIQKGTIPGVASVTSPLTSPGTSAAGTKGNPTDVVLSTFPYFNQVYSLSGTGVATPYYNQFVAFSAGLIAEQNSGSPYVPYYVGSIAANTPIYAPNPFPPSPPGPPPNAPGAQAGITFPVTGSGVAGTSFALGWIDSSTKFHPYSFITGAFMQAYLALYDDAGHSPDGRVGAVGQSQIQSGSINWGLPDPRTGRFLMSGNFVGGGAGINTTVFPNNDTLSTGSPGTTAGIPTTGNFNSPQGTVGNGNCFPEDWAINSTTLITTPTAQQRTSDGQDPRLTATGGNLNNAIGAPTYYVDPDGVVRPGDGYYSNTGTGDGLMYFETAGTGGTAVGDTASTGDGTGSDQHGRRPVILNRPFRSVGELGYVFRDLPFKTLDFFTPSSADAALLDVFSLTDESKVSSSQLGSVVAGQVNLSNAPLPVIQAILSGGSKKDLDPTYNIGTETANLATAIANNLNPATGPNPLINRAALVTQIQPALQSVQGGTIVSVFPNTTDQGNKAYLESPVRALADVTNSRTWNLLIDIIAQSGQMSPTAATLDDFNVQAEKRYWLHVSIDRYTGKIVAQQLEPVYE